MARIYFAALWLMLVAADGQAHDGRVNITGVINDNTCTLSPDSHNFTVKLGSVSNRQFYHAGDGSAWQAFTLDLQNCGSTASGVTVSFSGQTDRFNADLLALDGGADSASGVGIAIYNADKTPIALGDMSELLALLPGESSVQLRFYARYVADGSVVSAGEANATATFILTYA